MPVHVTSGRTGVGLDELSGYVEPGRTVAFLGASGVGKSTLVNGLLGKLAQKTTRRARATSAAGTRPSPPNCSPCPGRAG